MSFLGHIKVFHAISEMGQNNHCVKMNIYFRELWLSRYWLNLKKSPQ